MQKWMRETGEEIEDGEQRVGKQTLWDLMARDSPNFL